MRKLTFAQNRAIFTFSRNAIFIWMMVMATYVQSWSQCTPESNTISGTVFEDAINDGTFVSTESGLGNVLVTLYGADGNSVASAISDVDGNYSFSDLSDDTSYRLEFQSSNEYTSGYQGEDNSSSIQFVEAPACEVNYGLSRKVSSCGTNPDLLLTCFVQGEIDAHPDFATIISTEHDFQVASSVSVISTAGETGSIWGLAQDAVNQNLYTASFVKQYAGLKYGPYAILKTELEGDKNTSKFVDVNDIIPQNLAGLTVSEDVEDCTYGNQVGRVGLGNLVISEDYRTLYTPVLDENLVVAIEIDEPTAATTKVFEMPRPVGIDATEEYRIFALEWHEGLLYVGGTVTASVSKNKLNSLAVVMTLDPETGTIAEIFRTSYIKGFWQDTKPESITVSHWFTDIDFNSRGEMIISFSDRIGHRYCKPSTNRLDQQNPDILMVAFNPDTQNWELESNGTIAGRSGTGIGNGDGPDGGEFFGFDNWPTNPTYHNETALGSIFVLPGSSEVVASVYDPLTNSYSAGLHRYSTEDGSKTGAIELYSHTIYPVFGKATGFGDIIARCAVETIEIGNYVWNDVNGNGLQDAGEEGLEGISLNLYDSECNLVGTTVTNEDGNYAFNDSNVDNNQNGTFDGVYTNTTYYIELDNTIFDENTGLYTFENIEYTICTADSGDNTDDMIDCDAQYDASSCLQSSFIEVNTTETNHSFDLALGTPAGFDLALKKEIVGNQFAKVGEETTFMITAFNQGGVSASSVTITDYLPSGFSFVQESNPDWEIDGDLLSITIVEKILPGTNISRTIKLLVNETQFANYTNVAEISEALNLAGDKALDVDSTPDAIEDNDNGGVPFTNTDNELNDNGDIDEDDHDPATPLIFDLAVIITLEDNGYYYGGDLVKFDITLYNQGNVDADLIKLVDFFPKALEFNSELNPEWSEEGDFVVMTDENILAAGESRGYCIYFNVSEINTDDDILNYIEIAESSPVGHPGSFDFDSTPDTIFGNDSGGEVFKPTDNTVNDHGSEDEDDQDPVMIKTRFLDLALMKTAQSYRVRAGEEVIFNIEVINQGTVPVSKIDIFDYIPEFLTLADDNWSDVGNETVKRTLVLDEPLSGGNKVLTTITLKVDDNVTPRYLVNYAEIGDVSDSNNRAVGSKDIDSTPDGSNSNDNGGVAGTDSDNSIDSTRDVDEDDHDPAQIVIVDSDIAGSECLENATNSFDGQYEEVFKITGPSGDGWYVAGQNNYYDVSSPDPGDGASIPQATGTSALLSEMINMPEEGLSMYSITLKRQDGDAAQLVLRNINDEIEVFDVLAESYQDVFITGSLAICVGETEEYCVVNPDSDITYEWSHDAGAAVVVTDISADGNFSCVSINWDAAVPDANYQLNVAPEEGCFAPGNFTVGIGSSSGAMACFGDMNLSLDGDCEVKITPNLILTSPIGAGQAYNVMLTTQSGEVIPNATLTAAHVGTTVTAKIIDACNGNSCWSAILVEDKVAPTIVCQDVTISCNKVDNFAGPFAEDNCGTIASVVMLKDSLTTLGCTDPGADEFVAVIDREYQATDAQGNKSEICKMRMFVEKVDLEDIVFPDTFLMLNNTALNCDAYDLDMDGVADLAITGVPTYNGEYVYPDFGLLCNTALTFEDDKRIINGVIKITRTWTAWRWDCNGTTTKIVDQLIEIRDTEAPSITCPSNINVSAVTGNCSGTVTLPIPQISDSCSPDGLTYTIKPPFGSLIKEGDSRVVTFPYSDTAYDVVYTAIDGAGMESTCTIQVTVTDNIAPVAICDQNTVVGLNSNGVGYAYALNIDDGSYDACGVQSIEIRRMDQGGPFSDRVLFDCSDLLATVIVELKVTDNGGLMNTCMANVVVQDKHAPEVTGPADTTIECGDNYLPLTQFGEFAFTDACGVDTTTTAVVSLNSCGLGTITRTFTATDTDGTASTSQTITVVNNSPFDFQAIVFPKDTMLTINTCEVDDVTNPANLPEGYNVPQYDVVSPCEMVSASPHDEIFTLLGDPNSVCFKIVRTWTVIDWCQLDINGAPMERSGVQTIGVINTLAPDTIMVTGLDDPIIATTCDSAMVKFTATSKDCVNNNLQSLIQIDLNSDFNTTNEYELTIAGVGASTTFDQMLPMGNHTAVVTFMNPCNQMTTTSFPINITNNKPPTIGCKSVSIGLEPWDLDGIPGPETEAACIYADSLALASVTFHECGVDFELSFSNTSIVKELCFDCNDIGIQEIELFAIDINGNVSSCISTVDVQDNNDTDICMDLKDCVTILQDTMVTLVSDCEYQVVDNTFDLVQTIADCGALTITHDYAGALNANTLSGASFPLGTTVVNWSITNGVMIEACQLTILVKDEIDPTITCTNPTINTSTLTGCTYTASGLDPAFADNCVDVTIAHDYIDAPSSITLDGASFPIGTTTVLFTVTDGSNNTATCEVEVTVADNEGPAIECVDDITFNDSENNDSNCAHTVVGNILDPTVNDECGTVATIEHDYAAAPNNTTLAGAEFPVGITTVIFTATDNFGNTSTCDVVITVIDNIDPSITCAPSITVNAGDSAGCNYVQNGQGLDPVAIIENCEALGFTMTHDYDTDNSVSNTTLDGATFPVGIYTIVWTITDAAGNTSTCTVGVTVIDNTAPECVDQGGPIDLIIGGSESITLSSSNLNVQYSDACGPVTLSFSPATLDCDPEGIVDVTVTVTDSNNNSVDCPIEFNIMGDLNVTCELNIDTVYLDINGNASIDAANFVDISGGGCGITYVPSIDISTFSCSDIANNPITITISVNGEECGTDNITVIDTIGPIVTCAIDQTIDDSEDGTNDCQFTVVGTEFDPSVIEACTPSTMVNDYNNEGSLDGAVFAVGGPYTIIWTVTDVNGNTSICSHSITVVDDVDPECVEQGIIDIDLQVGDDIIITEALLTAPFTDNCGVTSVTFSPTNITCANSGEFVVTATVTDAAGNTSECPVTFNVVVDESLACSFNIDTIYLNMDGVFNLIPDSLVDVTGGTCDGVQTITLDQQFASCNDVALNPFNVTISVNGVECGMDSLIVVDTIPPSVVCLNSEISCAEFDANFNSIAEYLETVSIPSNDDVIDNCNTLINIFSTVDSSGVNECNYGTILRTIVVEDPLSTVNDTCVQMITINGPTDPLTQADVDGIIPAMIETTGCNGGSPDVAEITIDSLTPFVDCGQFTVAFDDLSISEGCPDTINRTYTIEALCQDETFNFVQQIIVNDIEDPTFATIADTSIVANPSNCMASVDLSAYITAMDNCSAVEDLEFTYAYGDSGEMDVNTIDTLDAGTYTVTVTATDGCDNIGIDSFELMVIDTSELTVSCAKLIVFLDSITGLVDVSPYESLIVSGNCDNEQTIIASWDPVDLNDTISVYNCDSFALSPIIQLMYIFEVVDDGMGGLDTIPFDISPNTPGVTNDCKVETEIRDTTNVCGNTIFEIQGGITTVGGEGIQNYSMKLHGSNSDAVLSNEEGVYAFPMMPEGGNYTIGTYKNDDVTNGVTTLDLIMIQRHILGLAEFDSPYNYIAADINNNEKVNSSDLIALRKVILGIDAEFANNLSWRTIDAAHTFEDPTDPWSSPIPETYDVLALSTNMYVDFLGVKIGDINASATVNLMTENTSTRSDKKVTLISEFSNDAVTIRTDEAINVAGLQFTLLTGDNVINSIETDAFDDNSIGYHMVSPGVYNISIANAAPKSLDKGDELFSIDFNCVSCDLSVVIPTDKGLASELYMNDNLEVVELNIENRAADVASFSVVQNKPNPWSLYTQIEVTLTEANDVTVNVFDVNGRLVYTNTESLNAGKNTIQLDDEKVNGAGVYFYEISTNQQSAQYKMIKLK